MTAKTSPRLIGPLQGWGRIMGVLYGDRSISSSHLVRPVKGTGYGVYETPPSSVLVGREKSC